MCTVTANVPKMLEDGPALELLRSESSSRIGNSIWHATSLASTNTTLRQLHESGWAGHGSIVWADEQTQGRGRTNRPWHSPRGGGLFASFLLTGVEGVQANYIATIAVCATVSEIAGSHAALKWPNDVLLQGRKLAGILIDRVTQAAIVGVGINTNMSSEELDRIGPEAISLYSALGHRVDNGQLLERLIGHLQEQHVRGRASPEQLFHDWKKALTTLGQSVEVQTPRETWLGTAVDVALDGSLLVLNGKRLVRVYAADVRIRPR